MRNTLTGRMWLNRMDRGTRTPKAPAMPWTMTNVVLEMPLKKPMKQNKNDVSRQSMPYAFRYSAEARQTAMSLAKMVLSPTP